MKAKEIRRLAGAHQTSELLEAIEAVTEEERELLDVAGDDLGERLTHLLLASRIRARMDDGDSLKDAFRAEMSEVRGVLAND
jgi:NTP pyrophosphatase (non-canonical NTP hydrolase)